MSHQPYTYLIGWSALDRFYYGVKFGKGANPKTFWSEYFTSSHTVSKMRELYGEPDIIQVRKIFDSASPAIRWESRVLRKLNVLRNVRWLNENIAGAQIQTPERNKLRSEKLTGIKRDDAFKARVSEVHSGKIVKQSTKDLLSDLNLGEKHPQFGMQSSEQKKSKIGAKNKGNNVDIHTCPHCGKSGKGSIMFRHHFERCKHK